MKRITHDKLFEKVKKEVDKFPRRYMAAEHFDMNVGDLSSMMTGNMKVPEKVANQLGYKLVSMYEPIN